MAVTRPQRAVTKIEEAAAVQNPDAPKSDQFLEKGMLVNVVSGGRTLTGYEVLGADGHFIKFRGSIHVAPQTEIVLIPFSKIEAIGLLGER